MSITTPELLQLIAKGEGSHAVFHRECPGDDELARVLCAFANTRGGFLLVGVGSDRQVCGCPDPEDARSRIRLVAEEDLKPPLDLDATSVPGPAGTVLAVRVNTSDDRPHSIPGSRSRREIIVRVGVRNDVAEGATLKALRTHSAEEEPKDALESKILAWIGQRERESGNTPGDASPALFSQTANVGLRRASKAFISLERAGLLIGSGERYHRMYALP